MRTPTIELYADKGGAYRFRLVAKNGEPVASSEGYATLAAAKAAAKRLAAIAAAALVVDTTKLPKLPKTRKK